MIRPHVVFLVALCAVPFAVRTATAGYIFDNGQVNTLGTSTDSVLVRNSRPAPGNPTTLNVLAGVNVGAATVEGSSRIDFLGGWADSLDTYGTSVAQLGIPVPFAGFFDTVSAHDASTIIFGGVGPGRGPLYIGDVYGYDNSRIVSDSGETASVYLSGSSSLVVSGSINIHGSLHVTDHASAVVGMHVSSNFAFDTHISGNASLTIQNLAPIGLGYVNVFQSGNSVLTLGSTFRQIDDTHPIGQTRLSSEP